MQILEQQDGDGERDAARRSSPPPIPGCMLQLQAGVRLHGSGQRVMHVVEVLDLAYKNAK